MEGLGVSCCRGLAERLGVVYALPGAALVGGDRSGERGDGVPRGRRGLCEVVGVACKLSGAALVAGERLGERGDGVPRGCVWGVDVDWVPCPWAASWLGVAGTLRCGAWQLAGGGVGVRALRAVLPLGPCVFRSRRPGAGAVVALLAAVPVSVLRVVPPGGVGAGVARGLIGVATVASRVAIRGSVWVCMLVVAVACAPRRRARSPCPVPSSAPQSISTTGMVGHRRFGGQAAMTGGHEATDTGLAYAPVSQAHGHHHTVQCFALLHCSVEQFCTTPRGC